MIITYRTKTGVIRKWEVDDQIHKAWRKYKRNLAVKEPCKKEKIDMFKKLLLKR